MRKQNKRKKNSGLIALIGLSILMLILAACGSDDDANAEGGETYTIDYSYVANEESPQHEGNVRFKELVEEKSDGQI